MCGIAGIFDTREQRPVDAALLSRMNEVQFHRGPDDGGIHVEPGVGLAHRRPDQGTGSSRSPFSQELKKYAKIRSDHQ